ncbi:MAG: AAA family ATPase [Betaproteobacteria bacterium]|nr:AAA family ATPase [Betaproteobacteria bacterium]
MTAKLVTALAKRLDAAGDTEVLETHISWVILAGPFAYKLKKPVDLGFADLTTLESRRRCCEEELRLGRRTAPSLYLAVIPITGSRLAPRIGGEGPPIEWAVRMRRFPQAALLDRLAHWRALDAGLVDSLAEVVATFHGAIPKAPAASPFGTPEEIRAEAEGNFTGIRDYAGAFIGRDRLGPLHAWVVREGERLESHFARRHAGGFVRECHGDLHLGNVALIEGKPVPFDAIDFDERLRWIDVTSEVAFTAMDLEAHGLHRLAYRFVDAYLAITGDYGSLEAFAYYRAYRALVRAKVAAIRYAQCNENVDACAAAVMDLERHLALAEEALRPPGGALIAMHGLPGSGKTTFSQDLLESLGAIRIRSDVERKRLHDLPAEARTGSAPGEGLYDREADDLTQSRLLEAARVVLEAGRIAIVDSTGILQSSRHAMRELARGLGVPFVLVGLSVPETTLRERITARAKAGKDASEAGIAVLERQMRRLEPLTADELEDTVIVEGARGKEAFAAAIEAIRARIA